MSLESREGWCAVGHKNVGRGRLEETKQDEFQTVPLSPGGVLISQGTTFELKNGKRSQGGETGLDLHPCPLEEGLIGGAGETGRGQKKRVKPFVYVIAWTAAISGLLFGYDVGGSGGTFVMASFRSYFGWPPTESGREELAWVVRPIFKGWLKMPCSVASILRDSISHGTVMGVYGVQAGEQGWITASATLGCILGSLPSGVRGHIYNMCVCNIDR